MYDDERDLTRPATITAGVFDDLNITPEALALIRRVAHAMTRSRTYRNDAPVLAFRVSRRAVPGIKQPHWRVLIGDDPLPGKVNGVQDALPLEGIPAPATKPLPADEPEEDEYDGCECDDCEEQVCGGDCAQCPNHDCQQCWHRDDGNDDCDDHGCDAHWPEGCPGDDISSCCGQCSVCERHADDADRDEVCDRGHCHECGHVCEDVRPYRRYR